MGLEVHSCESGHLLFYFLIQSCVERCLLEVLKPGSPLKGWCYSNDHGNAYRIFPLHPSLAANELVTGHSDRKHIDGDSGCRRRACQGGLRAVFRSKRNSPEVLGSSLSPNLYSPRRNLRSFDIVTPNRLSEPGGDQGGYLQNPIPPLLDRQGSLARDPCYTNV